MSKRVARAANAAEIKAPVLLFHGDKDINVQIRRAADDAKTGLRGCRQVKVELHRNLPASITISKMTTAARSYSIGPTPSCARTLNLP